MSEWYKRNKDQLWVQVWGGAMGAVLAAGVIGLIIAISVSVSTGWTAIGFPRYGVVLFWASTAAVLLGASVKLFAYLDRPSKPKVDPAQVAAANQEAMYRQAVLLGLFDVEKHWGVDLAQLWNDPTRTLQFGDIEFSDTQNPESILLLRDGLRQLLGTGELKWTNHAQGVFTFDNAGLKRALQLNRERGNGITKQASDLVARLRAEGQSRKAEQEAKAVPPPVPAPKKLSNFLPEEVHGLFAVLCDSTSGELLVVPNDGKSSIVRNIMWLDGKALYTEEQPAKARKVEKALEILKEGGSLDWNGDKNGIVYRLSAQGRDIEDVYRAETGQTKLIKPTGNKEFDELGASLNHFQKQRAAEGRQQASQLAKALGIDFKPKFPIGISDNEEENLDFPAQIYEEPSPANDFVYVTADMTEIGLQMVIQNCGCIPMFGKVRVGNKTLEGQNWLEGWKGLRDAGWLIERGGEFHLTSQAREHFHKVKKGL